MCFSSFETPNKTGWLPDLVPDTSRQASPSLIHTGDCLLRAGDTDTGFKERAVPRGDTENESLCFLSRKELKGTEVKHSGMLSCD